ncbi:unnamed protein product [Effrenium voratum]|nr:unnamed protein product [Effrenium voratum]
MIGLSALVAYLSDGKITGISGILGPFLKNVMVCQLEVWKMLFLIGLILGGLANNAWNASFAFPGAEPFSTYRYLAAGIAVGAGSRLQRGCTSGHGICGLPRFSQRSWMAVPSFMLLAGIVVYVTRHVLVVDPAKEPGIAALEWPPSLHFPVAALGVSLMLTALSFAPLGAVHGVICPLSCGTIFGLGLGVAGMTSQDKVLDFLDVAGYWDPSLAFVMGLGICVSFPAFYKGEKEGAKPVCAEKFENPPKTGDTGSLLIGAALFGLGWGLTGICPGPGLAGTVPNLVNSSGTAGLGFAMCTVATGCTWVITDGALKISSSVPVPRTNSDEKPLLPN